MAAIYPNIDRLRKLKFDQPTQLADALLNAIHNHADPIGVIEHLLIAFPHGHDTIEPSSGDPKPEVLDDNEFKFYRDRVSGRVDQVRMMLQTRNPTLHHAAEIVWGALCSFPTGTEKIVAFSLILRNPGIVPFAPIPEAVLQPLEPEYVRDQAKDRLLDRLNLLRRMFHDPHLSHQSAVRGAQILLDQITDPTERFVFLEQLILIAAHFDCMRDKIREQNLRLPDGTTASEFIQFLLEQVRKTFEHDE